MMKTSADAAMMVYWFNEADGVLFCFKMGTSLDCIIY